MAGFNSISIEAKKAKHIFNKFLRASLARKATVLRLEIKKKLTCRLFCYYTPS